MCLFITVVPQNPNANESTVKRVLKGASVLSVFPETVDQTRVFFLANDAHCACDLRASGPDSSSGEIGLVKGAQHAVGLVGRAMLQAGFSPFEFRVYWAGQQAQEQVQLDTEGFSGLVASNAFGGNTTYVVSE